MTAQPSEARRRALVAIALLALLLRVLLMAARGDYVMYDEGYYLLIARSIAAGEGFVLNGLPHVSLSPLQPTLVALLARAGLPLLLGSRLLAIVAGTLLVLPVAAIGRRLAGERAGLLAALLVATAPALMTFAPFFPGRSWNLYFGSEPLYLLVVFGALALAMRAVADGGRLAWIGAGALAAAAYLTRGEGVVFAPLLMAAAGAALLLRRAERRAWRGWATALLAGLLCATPYVLYLRATLGRWAFSGRVQAAATAAAPAPAPGAASSTGGRARRSGEILDDFVWGGDREALWNATYRLDPSGRRMASQYWGVPPAAEPAPADLADAAPPPAAAPPRVALREGDEPRGADVPQRAASSRDDDAPLARARLKAARFARGLGTVLPVWLILLAGAGLLAGEERLRRMLWLAPVLASALLPAIVAYVEPRSFLPLVPVAALGAALLLVALDRRLAAAGVPARGRFVAPALAALTAAVQAGPALRDLRDAWGGARPLQVVSTSRRAVGEYLGAHLPPDAIVASWHPSVAYFAGREWRVLPYEPLGRVLGYARAQGVSAIVLSRFEPSPLSDPRHPFQVLLLDPAAPPPDAVPRLATVEETPLVIVRRVLPSHPR